MELRAEIKEYIDNLSDAKLVALKPLLSVLIEEPLVVETDLTDEEKEIIRAAREEHKRGEGGHVAPKDLGI